MHNGHLSFHMRIYKKRERFNMSTVKSFTDQKQLKRHLHIHRGEKLLYYVYKVTAFIIKSHF